MFGDGAIAEGVLHESFNLAAVWKLPVLFVCENNGWSEFSPTSQQVAVTACRLVEAHGIRSLAVDGNDVIAVSAAARELAGEVRDSGGPRLIECKTTRVRGHFEGDPQKYRDPAEMAAFEAHDPILRAGAGWRRRRATASFADNRRGSGTGGRPWRPGAGHAADRRRVYSPPRTLEAGGGMSEAALWPGDQPRARDCDAPIGDPARRGRRRRRTVRVTRGLQVSSPRTRPRYADFEADRQRWPWGGDERPQAGGRVMFMDSSPSPWTLVNQAAKRALCSAPSARCRWWCACRTAAASAPAAAFAVPGAGSRMCPA
jgi:hypothetical protein